jgi:hypothetical protein
MHPHIPRPRRKATRTDTAGVVRTVHGEFMWPFAARVNEKTAPIERIAAVAIRRRLRDARGRIYAPPSTARREAIATSRSASARISTEPATWWNGSLIGSNSVGGSQRVTTSSPRTTWPSSSSHSYGCGCALMSPRTHRRLDVGRAVAKPERHARLDRGPEFSRCLQMAELQPPLTTDGTD